MKYPLLDWYLPNQTAVEMQHSSSQKSFKSKGYILICAIHKINYELNMVKNHNGDFWFKKEN